MKDKISVIARPSKEFFISMLTRDILLKQAIIELIDNSLDGARKFKKDEEFSGLFINVNFDKDSFSIVDNCGGIDLNTAINYAFCFGRPKDIPDNDTETAGFFGIGMKRALFKIGRSFEIESTTLNSKFNLNVDVDKWLNSNIKQDKKDEISDDWNFEINDYDNDKHSIDEVGTRILVSNLFSGVSADFVSTSFINELTYHIKRRISLEIERGLNITINNYKIEPIQMEILNNDDIKPIKQSFEKDGVSIDIIAGISKNREPKDAGWYIYCNKRLIVAADKSSLTTWKDEESEDGIVKYHNDYASFRGFIFFSSKEPGKLPWNTTKTNIDKSSSIYSSTKEKLLDIFNIIQPFIKNIYTSNTDNDIETDLNKDDKEITDKLFDMPSVKVNAITAKTEIVNNMEISTKIIRSLNTNPTVTIKYSRPQKEVEAIKKVLKVRHNSEVGVKTFEYFLDAECEIDAR